MAAELQLTQRPDGLYLSGYTDVGVSMSRMSGAVVHLPDWCEAHLLGGVVQTMLQVVPTQLPCAWNAPELDEHFKKMLAFARAKSPAAFGKSARNVFISMVEGAWVLCPSRNPGGTGRKGFTALQNLRAVLPGSTPAEVLGKAILAALEQCTF